MKPFPTLLFLIVIGGVCSSQDTITIKCDGMPHVKKYHEVYTIMILINNSEQAGYDSKGPIDPGKGVSLKETVKVQNVSGELSKKSVHVEGITVLDCKTLPTIQCQLFGQDQQNRDYKTFNFTPVMHINHMDGSVTVNPEGNSHFLGTEVELTCSARVVLYASKLHWYVENMSGNTGYELLHQEVTRKSNGGGDCVDVLISRVRYISNVSGDTLFDCRYGSKKIASKKVSFVDPEDTLSLHLFLSSIILAYIPNVIVPAMDGIKWCPPGFSRFRKADNIVMKWFRTSLSAVFAVIFVIWTSILAACYWSTAEWFRYSKFFGIESIFMFLYPLLRASFISMNERDRRPYNARVIISHGIVMTPLICWVMLKESPFFIFTGVEVLFLFFALPSVLSFVFVSYDREWIHWDKKEQ